MLKVEFGMGNLHYPIIQILWNVMSYNLDALECNYSYIWFIHRNLKGIIYFFYTILRFIKPILIFLNIPLNK